MIRYWTALRVSANSTAHLGIVLDTLGQSSLFIPRKTASLKIQLVSYLHYFSLSSRPRQPVVEAGLLPIPLCPTR